MTILIIKSKKMAKSSIFVFVACLLTVLFVRHLLLGYSSRGYLAKKHIFSFIFAIFSFVFYLLEQNLREFQVYRMGVSSHGGVEMRSGGAE